MVDTIFVVSKSIKRIYEEYTRGSDIHVSVLENSFSKSAFSVKTRLRRKIPIKPLGLVYGGVIGKGRDIETAVMAAKLFPFIKLLLAGRQEADFVKSLKLKSAPNITLMPQMGLDNLAKLHMSYGASLVSLDCLNKNCMYALPNKLFFSITCGTPVICTYNLDVASIIIQEGMGVLYKSGDVNSFVNSYEELIENYSAMTLASLTAQPRYSWENMGEKKLLEEYHDICNK
jgi:glycosyltransferase involved in cell wall biosynthesis